MAKGGGSAPGGAEGGPAAGSTNGPKPFVATPGREEARAVQRDGPPRAAAQLMARQDQATAHPGMSPARPQGPAQVASTNWVEQDQQARLAQAAARSASGVPMPAPGGTVAQAGPTPSEAQAIEAMRARMAKAWGVPGEATYAAGVQTRHGQLRAWTAELPGKAKGRDEEREP